MSVEFRSILPDSWRHCGWRNVSDLPERWSRQLVSDMPLANEFMPDDDVPDGFLPIVKLVFFMPARLLHELVHQNKDLLSR